MRQIFFGNLKLKAMALAMGTLFWFYIDHDLTQTPEPIGIPLTVAPPANVVLLSVEDPETGLPVREVSVEIEASKEALNSLVMASLRLEHHVVDVGSLDTPIVRDETFTERDVNLPTGIKVVAFTPAHVRVRLDRQETVTMRILEDCARGAPGEGFRVSRILIEPSEVPVRGPAAIVRRHQEIALRAIDITGRTAANSPVVRNARIQRVLEDQEVFCDEPIRVSVWIEAVLAEIELSLPVQVCVPPDFPYRFELTPKERKVRLRGPREALDRLGPQHVNLFIDPLEVLGNWANVKPGETSFNAKPRFSLREGVPRRVEVVGLPEEVTVTVPAP